MQCHERSDQHHNDQHWSHANNFLGRRIVRSTMAVRRRRCGIGLSVQNHKPRADLGRPSFWITLQISRFMVPSSVPVVFVTHSSWSSIHHCSITLGLPMYSLQFLPSKESRVWASCRASLCTFRSCCRQGGGRNSWASQKSHCRGGIKDQQPLLSTVRALQGNGFMNKIRTQFVRLLDISDPANPRTLQTFDAVSSILLDDGGA